MKREDAFFNPGEGGRRPKGDKRGSGRCGKLRDETKFWIKIRRVSQWLERDQSPSARCRPACKAPWNPAGFYRILAVEDAAATILKWSRVASRFSEFRNHEARSNPKSFASSSLATWLLNSKTSAAGGSAASFNSVENSFQYVRTSARRFQSSSKLAATYFAATPRNFRSAIHSWNRAIHAPAGDLFVSRTPKPWRAPAYMCSSAEMPARLHFK